MLRTVVNLCALVDRSAAADEYSVFSHLERGSCHFRRGVKQTIQAKDRVYGATCALLCHTFVKKRVLLKAADRVASSLGLTAIAVFIAVGWRGRLTE